MKFIVRFYTEWKEGIQSSREASPFDAVAENHPRFVEYNNIKPWSYSVTCLYSPFDRGLKHPAEILTMQTLRPNGSIYEQNFIIVDIDSLEELKELCMDHGYSIMLEWDDPNELYPDFPRIVIINDYLD